MRAMEPLTILLNAEAGLAGPPAGTQLAQTLAERGITAVIEVVEPARLTEHVQRLAGRPWLGVAGGDGTQRTAARELAGTDTVLVPFPTGRLNHFARRLGLETVEATAAALREPRIRSIPLGRANDHLFVNTAVVGSYVRLIRIRERLRPVLTTWPAATVASLVLLARWTEVQIDIRTPDRETRCSTAMFWAGIGRGSFPAPHRAPLPGPDAMLELALLPDGEHHAVLAMARAAFRHRLGRRQDAAGAMGVFHAPHVEIDSDRPLPVALDGEPHRLRAPLRISVEPDLLRALAPRRVDRGR